MAGACCDPDTGDCSEGTENECIALETWIYQGDDTTCTPNPCQQPTGACCFDNGTCGILDQSSCGAQGGVWQGTGTACSPNPCPQPPEGEGSCQITFSAFIATQNIPALGVTKGRRYWISDQTTDEIEGTGGG